MKVEKELIPQFETEEQEAEYWDSHSPLDLAAEPKAQKVRVRGVKDRPITIRLDSKSRSELDRLAAERGLGPSTFARLILMSVIEPGSKLPKRITLDELKNMLEARPQLDKSQTDKLEKLVLEPICALLEEDIKILNLLLRAQVSHAEYEKVKTLVQSHK